MSIEIPECWVNQELEQLVTKVGSGATPRGGSDSYHTSGIPLIRSQNVRFEGFDPEGLVFLDEKQARSLDNVTVRPGDVLLNITGASIGRVCIAPAEMNGARVNQHVCIIRPAEGYSPLFLTYYLSSPQVQRYIWSEQYGVTRQALTKSQILNFDVPVPPLREQERIAKVLDEVLTKNSEVRREIERIPTLLRRFRQSVLAAACSGRLTEDWRGNTDLTDDGLPNGWSRAPVSKLVPKGGVFDGPFGSNLKSSDYTGSGVRVIRLENVGHLRFKGEKQTFVSKAKYETLKRHAVAEGDIIFASFIDEEIRTCILPPLDGPAIAKADCFCIRPSADLVHTKFLTYQLVSQESYDVLVGHIHGATRPRINTTQLKTLEIRVGPLKEQAEIIKRVERLFSVADDIEARYNRAKELVDKLPQAILAKAFRGEM